MSVGSAVGALGEGGGCSRSSAASQKWRQPIRSPCSRNDEASTAKMPLAARADRYGCDGAPLPRHRRGISVHEAPRSELDVLRLPRWGLQLADAPRRGLAERPGFDCSSLEPILANDPSIESVAAAIAAFRRTHPAAFWPSNTGLNLRRFSVCRPWIRPSRGTNRISAPTGRRKSTIPLLQQLEGCLSESGEHREHDSDVGVPPLEGCTWEAIRREIHLLHQHLQRHRFSAPFTSSLHTRLVGQHRSVRPLYLEASRTCFEQSNPPLGSFRRFTCPPNPSSALQD